MKYAEKLSRMRERVLREDHVKEALTSAGAKRKATALRDIDKALQLMKQANEILIVPYADTEIQNAIEKINGLKKDVNSGGFDYMFEEE